MLGTLLISLKSSARKLWKSHRLNDINNVPKIADGIQFLETAVKEVINENIITNAFKKAWPFLYDKEDNINVDVNG
jgi:hypothetical protein